MTRRFFWPITCLLMLSALSLPAQTPHEIEQLSVSERPASGTLEIRNDDKSKLYGYDYHYLRCHWQVDPAVRYIGGDVLTRFTVIDQPMTEFRFELYKDMEIQKIVYHLNELNYTRSGDYDVSVTLPTTVVPGTADSIQIFYKGVPASNGFGSFEQTVLNNGPVLWTLSEPNGARDWWPCKQDLNDKIDSVDFYITTPVGNRVASNGRLVTVDTLTSGVQYHWRHRYPIDYYLIALATTNYAEFIDTITFKDGTKMPLHNMMFPEYEDNWRAAMPNVKQQMLFYNDMFGNYPFSKEKYGHAQFGWGGGMEHQTMSYMINLSYGLTAHEMAHQWFGDKITCCSWNEIWLNEGFATFLTALCQERFFPDSYLDFKKSIHDNILSRTDGSVKVPEGGDVNRIFSGRLTYNKGSYLLHMLRWELGDSTFFRAMRKYINDPALVYNSACTEDLKDHFEAESGLDLDYFFDDWFEGQGYPIYHLDWYQNGDGTLNLSLSQETSHPSVSFFRMHVPILLKGKNGIDSLVVFDNTLSNQQLVLPVGFTVDSIFIDPYYSILCQSTVQKTSAVKGNQKQGSLMLRPNPAMDKLYLTLNDKRQISDIMVTDMNGKLIKKISATGFSGEINISALAAGTYIINVIADKTTFVGKFIKL